MHFIEAASPEKGSFLRSSTSTLTLIWLRSKGHIHHGARPRPLTDNPPIPGCWRSPRPGGRMFLMVGLGGLALQNPQLWQTKDRDAQRSRKEWSIDSYLNGRKDIEIMKISVYISFHVSLMKCTCTCALLSVKGSSAARHASYMVLHWNMACDFNVCANSYTYKLSTNN